jgi:hypothetical protein
MAQQGLTDFKYPSLVGFANDPRGGRDVGFDPTRINEFDITAFNREFENRMQQETVNNQQADSARLAQMNAAANNKTTVQPYDLSFSQMMIGVKDTWFELFDDLLRRQYYTETFTKDNRLFFIGLTIILIILLLYLLDAIFAPCETVVQPSTVYNLRLVTEPELI